MHLYHISENSTSPMQKTYASIPYLRGLNISYTGNVCIHAMFQTQHLLFRGLLTSRTISQCTQYELWKALTHPAPPLSGLYV